MSLIDIYYPKKKDDEEEEIFTPSQKARVEQKQKGNLLDTYYPAKKKEEPKEKQTSFWEKTKEVTKKATKAAKDFLFGKKKEELETPEGFSKEQYASLVSTVQKNKIDTQRDLDQSMIELSSFQKGLGVHQAGANPEEERLILKTNALKETVKHYDNFITREPARRGVLSEIFQAIKDPAKILGTNKFWETQSVKEETKVMQKYERGEDLSKDEMIFYNKFRSKTLDSYIKRGLGSSVGEVVVNMPSYMMEIAVMSQMAGPEEAYKSIAAGFSNLTKITSPVAKTIVSKIVTNSVRKAVASQISISSVDSKTAEYMLPTYEIQQEVDGKDYLKLVKPGFDKDAAVSKAYASTLVEFVSEGVGDYVDDAIPFVKKLFISKWLKNNGVDEAGTATKFLRKLNFNSIVGEVLEEEVAEPLQSIIDERKYNDPFFTPEGRERLLVETLGIGVFSGISKVSDYTQKAITKRKKNFPNDIVSLNVAEGEEAEKLEAEAEEVLPPEEEKEAKPPKKEEVLSPQKQMLLSMRSGTGKFEPGEMYEQVGHPQANKIIIEGRDEEGNIIGNYVHDAGLLSEGKFKPEELKPVAVKEEAIDYVLSKFGLEREKRIEGKPEAPAEKPKEDRYYAHVKKEFLEVEGKPVEIHPEVDTFVYKREKDKKWVVTESRTGMEIGAGKTRKASIEQAKERINNAGINKVKGLVKSGVKKFGLSPRYGEKLAKRDIIKEDEKPKTSIISGREARPETLPDTVPEGKEPPGAVEEGVVEPSETTGGKREPSDDKLGKRPSTRVKEIPDDVLQAINEHLVDGWETNLIKQRSIKMAMNDVTGNPVETERLFKIFAGSKAIQDKAREAKIKAVSKVSKLTLKGQAELNKQIEELVARKDESRGYTPEDIELLKQYTGAGGLEKGGVEGRGLLDEYYTPPKLVKFIWDEIENYLPKLYGGVTIGDVLEPAAGIGGFFEPIADVGDKRAFEINKTSAKIIKILYPRSFVESEPFESQFITDRGKKTDESIWKNSADIVVGNPPYGEHRGRYLGLGEEPKIPKYEEYFLKRGLDVLDKGGILAYVMPSTFLRGSTDYAKQEIAKMAQLKAAYRFPNGIFGTTDIGTDVLIFKKGRWMTPQLLSDDNYFNNYPKRVLGKVLEGKGNYGADLVEGTLEEALELAGHKVKEKVVKIKEKPEALPRALVVEAEKESDLDTGRVKAEKVVVNEANKKAIIVSTKKDSLISLSDVSEQEKEMWANVEVSGELNIEYIRKRFGGDKFQAKLKDFVSKDVAIEASVDNRYYPNILYYQGNIYDKLDKLEAYKESLNPKQYQAQKKGLEAVLPKTQKIKEISLKPNDQSFLPDLKLTDVKGVTYNVIDKFKEWMRELPSEVFGNSGSYEVRQYIDGRIVNTGDKIRNIEVRKRRRQVGDRLFARFLREELSEKEAKQLEDKYNRAFNAYHRPDYKKVPLLSKINKTFKGKTLKLTNLQKEGAAFLSSKGVGLLGYEVGLGKTMTSIVALNEVMEKGWVKKPLIVVPNAVYLQWTTELKELMPNVKINSLNNLGRKFKGDLKTLEIEDGTVSLITYSGLVKLGFRLETYDDLTRDLQDTMAGTSGTTKRAKAKEGEQIGQIVGKAIKGTSGDRFFEDLGFDHITIDEVHNFKNIFAGAKLPSGKGNEYRSVRGSTSARGIKAYLMTQYILKNNNGRNVFALSATPFTNSPMEIYSILSLMAKNKIESLGLKNVNDFMTMFMDMKSKFVVKANQTVVEADVIEGFTNLQQLQKLVTEFIDFRTGEEVGIERPDRIKKVVTLNPNQAQVDHILKAQDLFTQKDKGGAIVAITELQNITLSPYLSRYNEEMPTYKTFVDNSPKIKFAVEAVAQVRKDNKGVGQVIYMPRGVQYLNFIKQYLVKEKKFKANQIAIISGGMNVDTKHGIQNKFNSGEIKVLLGTESIKEGLNLQEKSTDLYHLHLPWNPTDMLQVEGRIWRQGNEWKNVRISYPLVENSVDSFIFQKLETKEKRIKNLWSYKGDNITVGDLDFENMKLDLITDPVIRTQAEKTFESAKQEGKIQSLEVEAGFAGRVISTLSSLEENLENYKKWKKEAISDDDAINVKYYSDKIKDEQVKLNKLKAGIEVRGINILELKEKVKKFEIDIKAEREVLEEIEKKYEGKLKAAEKEKISLASKPNDYAKITKEIAVENKKFFVKRKVLKARFKKAPGGTAELGGFSDIKSAEGMVSKLNIVEFPELVRFARALKGNTPRLKKFKRSLGKFYENGNIRLDPKIFEDPVLAAKVLAHEVGHLTDWLPDKTLVRGNILGRIASLKKHLKWTHGDLANNRDIRAELKRLSQAWKPFDETQNRGYTQYRYSSRELYADAVSVLMNDPALLESFAPKFFKGFTDYLDRKPKAREEYMKLQQLLERGSADVQKVRLEELYKGFDEGAKKRKEAFDKEVKKKSLGFRAATQHITKFYPIYKKLKGLPEKQRIRETLEEMAYSRNDVWLDLERNEKEVSSLIKKAGINEKQLGAWFVLERNLSDRLGLANPDGLIGEFNTEVLDFLKKDFTSEQQKIIKKAITNFHEATFEIVDTMHKEGMIKDDVFEEKIEPFRNSYVTFGVVKYIDKNYVNPNVQRMTGTLSKIENPYVTTMFKRASMLQALAVHRAKKMVIGSLKANFSDEIKESKSVLGKMNQKIYKKPFDGGALGLFEKGTWTQYDLDPYFADMFNHFKPRDVHTLVDIASKFNRVFKPTVTTYKIGWALYNNPLKDIQRTMRNLAAISKIEGKKWNRAKFLAGWVKTIPEGFRFGKGQLTPFGKLALGAKAISTPWISYDPTAGEDKALYALYRKYSFLTGADKIKASKKIRDKFLLPITMTLRAIELAGATIESTGKLAGYKHLSKQLENQKKVGFYTRNYLGTPNYLEGGAMKQIDNSLFVFSNVMLQGIRSDAELVKNPKSRGAYFFEMFLHSGMWGVLGVVAASGLLGKGLEDKYEKMTEYDKTNYLAVPLCYEKNGKVRYWRVPLDEVNRLAHAIIWKTGTALQKKSVKAYQIFNVGAGWLPSPTPLFEIIGAWFDYIQGINPQDSYYGRNVLDYQTEKIRGFEGFKKMSYWTLNKMGISNFITYDPAEKTTTEKIIQFTPVLSRALRTSDYGLVEKERETEKKETKEKAIESKKENETIDRYVKQYLKEGGDKNSYKQKIIKELEIKEKGDKTRIKKEFDQGILKIKGDSRVRTIMKLRLNTTKIQTLRRYKEEMDSDSFSEMMRTLIKNKVISDEVVKEVKKPIEAEKTSQLFSRTKRASLIKQVHAAEEGGQYKEASKELKEKNYRLMVDLRINSPDFYFKNFTQEDEKRLTGTILAEDYKVTIAEKKQKETTKPRKITKEGRKAISPVIDEVFGDEAENYKKVLENENKGYISKQKKGEKWKDYNYKEDASGKVTDYSKGNRKYIYNQFSKKKEWSEDRGLGRINNETFYTYLGGKKERLLMYEAGIIPEKHPKWEGLNDGGAKAKEYYELMYNQELNTKMAKLIFDKQGWRAWVAAPKELKKK